MTTRAVTNPGKIVATFASGLWSAGSGTLTQGHTGFDANGNRTGITSRTGLPEMLAFAPASDAAVTLFLASPSTNLRTKALNGDLMLVCYVESQPGYQPGGT